MKKNKFWTKIGDTLFSSDGETIQQIGDTYFHSNGKIVTKIGDTYFGDFDEEE